MRPDSGAQICLFEKISCEQDCSVCCFRSAEEKASNKMRRINKQSTYAMNETDVSHPEKVDYLRYIPRNVHKLQAQLHAAETAREVRKPFSEQGLEARLSTFSHGFAKKRQDKLRECFNILQHEGALRLPPAIACLEGIGSPPYRIYQIGGMDLLHCFDLGVAR